MKIEVTVTATVSPTESIEKVESTIRNIFGNIELKQNNWRDTVIFEGHLKGIDSLNHLKELLRRQRIRKAGRAFLSRKFEGDILTFGINRQAAYVGKISFYHAQEAPLGPIQVTVHGDTDKVVDYLCDSETGYRNYQR